MLRECCQYERLRRVGQHPHFHDAITQPGQHFAVRWDLIEYLDQPFETQIITSSKVELDAKRSLP